MAVAAIPSSHDNSGVSCTGLSSHAAILSRHSPDWMTGVGSMIPASKMKQGSAQCPAGCTSLDFFPRHCISVVTALSCATFGVQCPNFRVVKFGAQRLG